MNIKLGIIGFGGMGKWHAQNAPRAGVEIAAVCDVKKERREEAALTRLKTYASAEELLADTNVNTVILTVPNYLHKEMCLKAAAAGKNVKSLPRFPLRNWTKWKLPVKRQESFLRRTRTGGGTGTC